MIEDFRVCVGFQIVSVDLHDSSFREQWCTKVSRLVNLDDFVDFFVEFELFLVCDHVLDEYEIADLDNLSLEVFIAFI